MTALLLGTVASAYTVTTVPAAFKTALGTASGTSSGTTLAITTTAAIAVDDLVVVRWATDNSTAETPTATCADSGGNVYAVYTQTVSNVGTANAGVVGGILVSKATAAVSAGGTITLTLSGSVAQKAMYAESFTAASAALRGSIVRAMASLSSAASSGASTSASSGDLVIGHVAAETRTTPTGDSDTSNGTWSTLVNVNSTTGGTDDQRVQVHGQYKIATGTGTQTYNTTLGASTEWGASCAVLVPASSAPSKSSVRFDNSADIYSGSAAASDISTTAVTMCCWYYRISSTTDPTLVGIQRSGPDQYFLLRLISTTTVPGMVDNSASVNGAPTWNPNSNEWAFAACTFSSGTGKIYAGRLMDATLNTTSSTGFTGPNTAASVRIGNDTFPEPFNGRIAGVKIWNAALSAAELELERWTYSPVRTADLWAWYPLDGTSTADASGNGHTLTAGGSLTTEAGPPYAS